ncbi:MAG: glycosyltransferase, partial [Chloroflexi bacterium]|nr:glycosyltransferase [Chloroflexota bacterium]
DRLPDNRVIVDPNGVDLEDFRDLPAPPSAREQLGLVAKFSIGYIGHLYPGRGVELIFGLAAQLPHLQFLLAGGTQVDIDNLKAKASQQNLDNIVFLGFLPNRTLPLVYAACDVLLMPYQRKIAVFGGKGDSSSYMSPMKMFEYMASRRVILSSDIPVLREILNERNAVLCDPENDTEWRDAILRAAADSAWSARLAQQARAGNEIHTWEMRARRALEDIL